MSGERRSTAVNQKKTSPAWRRLLEDIENSLINCIVVKDLSRIGRDFDEVEKYLAEVFPLKDVRVILTVHGTNIK